MNISDLVLCFRSCTKSYFPIHFILEQGQTISTTLNEYLLQRSFINKRKKQRNQYLYK